LFKCLGSSWLFGLAERICSEDGGAVPVAGEAVSVAGGAVPVDGVAGELFL
jgi:hypothetical protein